MSELIAHLKDEQKQAMRAKAKERLTCIRTILAEVKRVEVDERIDVDDPRMLVILDKMQKQRRDSIAQFTDAGRDDLVAIEEFELGVIKEFLPAQLTEDEIVMLIDQAIAHTGAVSMQDMSKVMGAVKPDVQGRADMGKISGLIKARLS